MKCVLLFLVCLTHALPGWAQQSAAAPKPAVPIDAITGIIEAFKAHDIVALGEGDHGNEPGHAFRLSLIRDPRFAATVDDIVVECGNSLYQDVMDRFIRGEDVKDKELRQVWQNTTQPHAVCDRPIYEQFFRAVRAVNASLPGGRQLRVLLGDPPIDWSLVKGSEDVGKFNMQRDSYPAALIEREVLAKKRRALLVYGDMHYSRKNLYFAFKDREEAEKRYNAPMRTIVGLLESAEKTKVFSIWTYSFGDPTTLQPNIASWHAPALVLIRDTNWGLAPFMSFYPSNGMMMIIPTKEGGRERVGLDPQRSPSMQEQFDAVLYLGPPATFTYSKLSAELCADPEYIEMRTKRMALAMITPPGAPAPDAGAQLKRLCAEATAK